MDKYYFLTRYEIDCLERSIEELILIYPHVPSIQIRQDMIEIRHVIFIVRKKVLLLF
jgi:hypothetical protein